MTVPVLTAVTGSAWESQLVADLERGGGQVSIVRRCVDLADLLAAASAGTARAALLSADLRRLDRDALSRLAAARVAVVGLVTPGDETAERRLRQLGLSHVLRADTGAEGIARAVDSAVEELVTGVPRPDYAEPMTGALPDLGEPLPVDPYGGGRPDLDTDPLVEPGRLVAVWGPTGAPGRTTVATALAAEAAAAGTSALLADADVYGGVVAQVLGLLDESPGLAAAARLANNGSLDLAALARSAPVVLPGLRVLTGIARADRWTELRPSALEVVWDLARRLAELTVVDCGFSLEQDEELSFDTSAPRRNGATLLTLEKADVVVVVGQADPVGVQRLVRSLAELREALPGLQTTVVVNKVRASAIGSDPQRQIAEALDRYAGVRDICFVPYDLAALDASIAAGRTLSEVAPRSPARLALAALAGQLTGTSASGRSGRAGRRRRGRRTAGVH